MKLQTSGFCKSKLNKTKTKQKPAESDHFGLFLIRDKNEKTPTAEREEGCGFMGILSSLA